MVHQSRDIYEISWLTISYQEMLEYRLLYRAVQVTEVHTRPNNTILPVLLPYSLTLKEGGGVIATHFLVFAFNCRP